MTRLRISILETAISLTQYQRLRRLVHRATIAVVSALFAAAIIESFVPNETAGTRPAATSIRAIFQRITA